MQALNDTKWRTLETFKNQKEMASRLINTEGDKDSSSIKLNGTYINSLSASNQHNCKSSITNKQNKTAN